MQDELRGLIREWPLPPGFSEPQLFADTITVGDASIRRAGIQAGAPDHAEVTGSAAARGESPLARAYFELLERAALLDAAARTCPVLDAGGQQVGERAPDPPAVDPRSRRARSNGVALHRSWTEACRRARFELVERDRVLRSWYGELALVPADPPRSLDAFARTHEWCARSIPDVAGAADADVEVAVVVGFPRDPRIPLARGFAGRATRTRALDAAAAEAVQSLAFTWDEPVPSEPPALTPTPLFHLDYYLWPGHHERLREWLEGTRVEASSPATAAPEDTRFVDLTPPSFGQTLRVARAVRSSARELIFGEASPELRALLPSTRHVHPIP